MTSEERLSKAGGFAAIVGTAVLAVATWLHPLGAHPNDAPAAFAEYAGERFWVAIHLAQLAGVVLAAAGLLALAWRLRRSAPVAATFGSVALVVAMALAAATQAVDGVALKAMVDRLADADAASRAAVYEATFAVRQLEIGLGSIAALFNGLAAALYGAAQLRETGAPRWLGCLGIGSGAATFAGGIVQAHDGFSDATMALSMPGGVLLALWITLSGWRMLRGSVGAAAVGVDAA